MAGENKNKKIKTSNVIVTGIWWIIIILMCFLIIFQKGLVKNSNYSELLSNINNGKVTNVSISSDRKKATFIKDNVGYEANIPSIDTFMNEANEKIKNGDLKVNQKEEPVLSILFKNVAVVVPYMLMILVLYFWYRALKPKAIGTVGNSDFNDPVSKEMSFGKSKARLVDNENPKVKFKDVAGIDEEKEELKEIVDFLKNPQKYIEMGARIPKGVLLVGRPGTGKTLLAKAVAGEAGVPFYIISGSDFVELYVGVGAKRVREMFLEAKKNSPCIIFIDEIDAVGRQRGAGLGGGNDEREQTLNQLLVEMDGFGENEGVIVIAATNRPDVLDSALLRPGRFDRQIVIGMPDSKAREEILKVHSKNKKFADDVDFKVIAKNTPGFAGADLENILNEAALIAARTNKERITNKDVEEAMVKVSMGPEKKSRVFTQKDRKLVSYHEAGHALVSAFLPTQDRVHEISIIPRGMAGGYTMYKSSEDKSFMSKKEMEESIISLLGGRLAEELIIGDISTGASNDIQRASQIARSMVTKYGMSKVVGTIDYGQNSEQVFIGRDLAQTRNMSEKTASVIDDEVKNIIDSAYVMGKEILETNEEKLHAIAKVLMEKEKITGEEFAKIVGIEYNEEEEKKITEE